MTFYVFENGTLADADEVNYDMDVLSKQNVINRLNWEVRKVSNYFDTDGANNTDVRTFLNDYIDSDGFEHELLFYDVARVQAFFGNYIDWQQTDTSYADTSNSTCYYDEGGLVAFCDVLDLFDDASIDTNIWSTSGSPTESSGELNLDVSSDNSSNSKSVISNGASGLDLLGADAEIVLSTFTRIDLETASGDSASGYFRVQLSDGTNHVNILNRSASASTGASNDRFFYDHLRISYDDSAQEAYLALNGGDYGGAIDLSSLSGNVYIRLESDSTSTGDVGDIEAQTTARVNGVGYRKDGASAGTVVFQTSNKTIDSSTSVFLYNHFEDDIKPGNQTAAVSLDGGSTFDADEVSESWAEVASGTSLVFKTTGDKPTSITGDGSTKNIPVLKGWGALHD